jgi:methyl-accepting chemotaxis protein
MIILTPRERYRTYGLEPEQAANALKRLTADGTAFSDEGVKMCCDALCALPGVGEQFRSFETEMRLILRDHYRALLADGLNDAHFDRVGATVTALESLGTDLRSMLATTPHIVSEAIRTKTGNIMLGRKQLMADLAVLQAVLVCDSATALSSSQTADRMHEDERRRKIAIELSAFRSSMNGMSVQLADASRSVAAATDVVAAAAAGALQKSRFAADAAEQGNNSLTASATSTEELSQATAELERRTESSRQAVAVAEAAVSGAKSAIADLYTAAEKIGSIVGLISNIAEQTNLLALNATIEAARAGDAGRGFAVVAQEVKALASQTTKATQDIVAQIAAVQDGTSRSVNEIGAIGEAMERLSQNTGDVAGAVMQQNVLTGELSRNLHETVKQVIEASEGYTAASALIENTSAETAELQNAMEALAEIGASLKRDVDTFSERLKAA